MNSDNKKIKSNKKIKVFLIFVIVAFVFWFLIKLSEEYTTNAKVKISYKDLPKDKLLQSDLDVALDVKIKSIGFNLLRKKIFKNEVEISLKDIKRKKGSVYYYLTSNMIPSLDENFSKSEVISIKPDTLFFDLSKSASKKIKVTPNIDVQYELGYNLLGSLKIEPEYITVTGPQTLIDTIQNVYTEELKLNNVNSNIESVVSLFKNTKLNKVKYSNNEVKIIGVVEKFTERTILVDFSIKNLSNSLKITTYPKQVELVFQVGLSDFNNISKNDFEVVCDFKEVAENEINYLIPKLKKQPNFIKEVKIVPSKIEYLIEK